ncbi:competence protein ComEA [Cronobacter dublinensis subsp. dublinensis]|uniref:helix-hairpin-helix domain-containing protein n=1 Tax=Cronobacter dublinensis TaxID=413497 RepID=UPI001071FCD4|nr:competence protein ComEA [Cronobacter dublinensis subsp. dublinensis]ELY3772623.1 helix-hairpin-helix domain-containing protein [Cronobacter dublinensis]EGT5670072.1 competence protein ComEA [Cronobacter dublinensis subsp. dublinensis]EGT5674085.1 competence protein ComEA [Cronobacter dublinensis subsp. dublinensis]EGT5677799.1 competence protein ComEA [Cronobacter dublinensis subsp. dublinensis]
MKRGIKIFCLAVALAGGTFCTAANATPSTGKAQAEQVKDKPAAAAPQAKPESAPQALEETVSINTATADELAQAMNGVGKKKAQSIVSYREEYGPFKSLEDLKQVPGMGNSLVERNLSRIRL